MKWMLSAASAAIAAGLWLPGPVTISYAAQPAAPAETAATLPATGEDRSASTSIAIGGCALSNAGRRSSRPSWRPRSYSRASAAASNRRRRITTGLPGSATPSATAASASGSTRWTQTMTASSIPPSGPLGTISSAPFSAGAGPPPPNPPPRVSPASRPSPVSSLQEQAKPARSLTLSRNRGRGLSARGQGDGHSRKHVGFIWLLPELKNRENSTGWSNPSLHFAAFRRRNFGRSMTSS
jgi:hypothetical protein